MLQSKSRTRKLRGKKSSWGQFDVRNRLKNCRTNDPTISRNQMCKEIKNLYQEKQNQMVKPKLPDQDMIERSQKERVSSPHCNIGHLGNRNLATMNSKSRCKRLPKGKTGRGKQMQFTTRGKNPNFDREKHEAKTHLLIERNVPLRETR